QHHQCGDDHKGDIATNHINLAVGEVDHADNAVNHGVADGYQRIGTAQRDAVKHLLQEIQKLLRHKVTFLNPPAFHGRWDDHLAAVDEPSACHWKTPKSNPLRSPFSSQFSGPITVFAPLAFKSFTSASGSSLPVRSRAVARDCTAA